MIRTCLAGGVALGLAVAVPVTTASAQDGDPVITNTETVNVSLDPSGTVDVARVYDQLAIQGSGSVAYANPVSTQSLRNLDEFGGFTVDGDEIVESTSVDGQLRRRALSDFDLELPVTVAVSYSLDGQPISPADLVGQSGTVEAVFRIENMTGEEEEITYDDGTGGTVTETAVVHDPFAGSLSFTLPPNFTDVVSDDGIVPAGDGRGGTLMNLSVTLISGLTDPFVEASYTATVSDAVVPPVTLSLIPVLIDANPSSAAQLAALQGGVESGQELASNGQLIDENVLALADGAAQLVNGIFLLRDGAAELSDGLVNTAAPGSAELAAGADELAAGLNGTAVPGSQQLAAGAGDLAAGLNGTAAPGADALAAGTGDLAAGIAALDAGLAQLASAVDDLPQSIQDELATNEQYQALLQALRGIIDGIGTKPAQPVADPSTLGEAIRSIEVGLSNPVCDPADPTNPANPCGVKEVVDLVASQLGDASSPGGDLDQLIQASIGSYQQAVSVQPPTTGAACPQNAAVPVPPVVPPSTLVGLGFAPTDICVLLSNVVYGLGLPAGILAPDDLGGVKAQTEAATAALNLVVAGIGDSSTDETLLNGLALVWLGLSNPACDPADPTNAGNPCGIKEITELVLAGVPALVDELVRGIQQQLQAALGSPTSGCDPTATLRCASAALVAGSTLVDDGANELASGLDTAADGSTQVADGADQLAAGLVDAADGSTQVADGANQLADGLGDAAAGSVQLSAGLDDAAEAGPALPQGAQRLSDEGTSLLAEAGEDTAQSFGERVALLEASAERTADGGLPYGGPEDAIVAAAYRYDLAEATGATAQNTGQLVAALVIAGAAVAGATVLARRTSV